MPCLLPRPLVRSGRNMHPLPKLTYEVRMGIARQIDPARARLLQFDNTENMALVHRDAGRLDKIPGSKKNGQALLDIFVLLRCPENISMSAIPQLRQAILTALYRDTAVLRPYSDRLIGEPLRHHVFPREKVKGRYTPGFFDHLAAFGKYASCGTCPRLPQTAGTPAVHAERAHIFFSDTVSGLMGP